MSPRTSTREQSALRLSIAASVVMAVLAVVWGLVSGSRVVLFDGVFVLIGTVLSGLGLAAARAAEAGASRRFPFGREAFTPLVIGVQGLALLGTCAYAVLDSVRVIASGGAEVEPGAVAGYAVVSAVVSWGLAVRLRRADPASELLDAEARQWMAGAVLSLVVCVGAVAALVLRGTAWSEVEAYVDPVLVIVSCVLIAALPVGMVRTMVTELLEGAPPETVQEPVRAAVAAVRTEHGLSEPDIRVGKVGRKLYVEVDFVVRPGERDVADEDRVRRAVAGRLTHLPYDLWLNVELTTDAQLLA
ncbi:cation diffusion facilitator family transporter [Blastococcus xanthinilyticus]|uniref:Cation diffusion facilitator family transporter n=1 Tax=Blastococcus xanthinilyticus TaxID=1564164 RepID=A0A5S5CKE3_9ACTN|nr:cation diffusion facilitator family transporter [Blastococcus xanthinilyticus]TYP81150.1 cation diffusion facilitator family transporter [Blastococcus xanthinilyticus]